MIKGIPGAKCESMVCLYIMLEFVSVNLGRYSSGLTLEYFYTHRECVCSDEGGAEKNE